MEKIKKEAAIITGASSGIGCAVSTKLCALGYEVFGLGRDFSKVQFEDEGFHPIVCDVLETEQLCTCVKQITSQCRVRILVNNAGVGYYGLHE